MSIARKIWFSPFLQEYTRFSVVLLLMFFLIRLIEIIAFYFSNEIPSGFFLFHLKGLYFDFITASFFSFILLLPFLILYSLHNRAGKIFMISMQLIVVVLNLVLALYFVFTLVPLDHALYGYTARDIMMTVKSSSGSVWKEMLALLFVSGIYFYVYRKIRTQKFLSHARWIFLVSGIAVVIFPALMTYAKNESAQPVYIINNKLGYFSSHSMHYITSGRKTLAMDEMDTSFLDEKYLGWKSVNREYPLLHNDITPDVLGSYFDIDTSTKPDIVFLVIESLSGSFFTEENGNGKFMPFLDSLKNESLYWPNFISAAERTFGVLPSVLGSLPYGEKGFTDLGENAAFPKHLSLISILKRNGYFSRFYIGAATEFNNMDGFLYNTFCDHVVGNWEEKYAKMGTDEQGFSWGYADKAIFEKAFDDEVKLKNTKPRFDIFLTSTMHEPYAPPHPEVYLQKFNEVLAQSDFTEARKRKFTAHSEKYASVIYTDEALKEYFARIKKSPRYKNTIFFIFGDHAMEDLFEDNSQLARHHIPFIVYSPMLKKPARFESVSSHFDVAPTLTAFMRKNYKLRSPQMVHWLGSGIDTTKKFRNVHMLPLIRNNRDIIDFVCGDYFLSNEKLYLVKPGFKKTEINNDQLRERLSRQLSSFVGINDYVCNNDKIYPERYYRQACPWNNTLYARNFLLPILHSDKEYFDLLPFASTFDDIYRMWYIELSMDFFSADTNTRNYPVMAISFTDKKNNTIHWMGEPLVLEDQQPLRPGKWNRISYIVRINREKINITEEQFVMGVCLWNNKKIRYNAVNIRFRIRYGLKGEVNSDS